MLVVAQSHYVDGYTPRHNIFTHTTLFTSEGSAEIKRLVEMLNSLVIGEGKEEDNERR